jgi:hypothetical protein
MMTLFSAKQVTLIILFSSFSFSACIPFSEAAQHVGETRCIKGKVLRVDEAKPGFASLSFCKDQRKCAFTALVAAANSENFSALMELQGRTIKIHGLVKDFNGDAQIVLQDSRQLLSDDSEMPSFMKAYDVEERGHYSAGTSHAPKTKRATTKKQTATLPIDIPVDSESSDDR